MSGAAPNYKPNSFSGPIENPAYRERPRNIPSSVDRHNQRLDEDCYTQPGNLFRLMTIARCLGLDWNEFNHADGKEAAGER